MKTEMKTPSPYGSHASMVAGLACPWSQKIVGKRVQLCDERGVYFTEKRRLDDGLADPNRWAR